MLHIVHCIVGILYFFIQEEDKGDLLVLRIGMENIFIQKAEYIPNVNVHCYSENGGVRA